MTQSSTASQARSIPLTFFVKNSQLKSDFTYHWIDSKWVLHSLPIGITHHKGTTNAEANANGLEAELAKHGLTWENVLAVVTDTEPTMNSAGLLFI